jgi:hypothetical protein
VEENIGVPVNTMLISLPVGMWHRITAETGDVGVFILTSHPGLCATCQYVEATETRRGSVFYRCLRAQTDASFRKYPPLPVRQCRGYQPHATEEAADVSPPESPKD